MCADRSQNACFSQHMRPLCHLRETTDAPRGTSAAGRALLQGNTKLTSGLAAILACLDLCDENDKNKAACARLRRSRVGSIISSK